LNEKYAKDPVFREEQKDKQARYYYTAAGQLANIKRNAKKRGNG
jgi:hypothetical protein